MTNKKTNRLEYVNYVDIMSDHNTLADSEAEYCVTMYCMAFETECTYQYVCGIVQWLRQWTEDCEFKFQHYQPATAKPFSKALNPRLLGCMNERNGSRSG